MAGLVGKALLVTLAFVAADESSPGAFLERKLQAYTLNGGNPFSWNTPGVYNSSSPKHYVELHEGYCYGVEEDHGMNGYLEGGSYTGKWEELRSVTIVMYANNSAGVGWDGGRCWFEGWGEFTLGDDEPNATRTFSRSWGIPHVVWCDQGPDPATQTGYFEISWYGAITYSGLVNNSDFTVPPAVDSRTTNSDWCARKCALASREWSYDGWQCRYFAFDSESLACRFYSEKGGCHPQPHSHRRRYGSSTAYLIPKESQTGLSIDHIASALEQGRDYKYSHAGFCASGWLPGMIQLRSSLDVCARWCRDVPVCGHFTYSPTKEACSLYDVDTECPSYSSDVSTDDFNSWAIIRPAEDDDHFSDYQIKHMGVCDEGSDFLGYESDRQFSYVYECAEHCSDTESCNYFSFSRRNFHCRLFGSSCVQPANPYFGPGERFTSFHGEPAQYGLPNDLQHGESNMGNGFTWRWEADEWYPWALPNTTDYMYTSYRTGTEYNWDPGVYTPSTWNSYVQCRDAPGGFTAEDDVEHDCLDFFPGWTCGDDQISNFTYGACRASCGICNNKCFDISMDRTNTHGFGCELYSEMPTLCNMAWAYNDYDFNAGSQCCACGGGSRSSCLPNNFVRAARPSDGILDNAFVMSLNPVTDEITVTFPYHTGSQLHTFPREEVLKGDDPCQWDSMILYTMTDEWGWTDAPLPSWSEPPEQTTPPPP